MGLSDRYFNKVLIGLSNISVSTFLLEIGTEELPADFARMALPQLEDMVLSDLKQRRLDHGSIKVTSTPRRLVLVVHELAPFAKDLSEDRKGPPAEQAFKDGLPTKAAIGFANRFDLEVGSLEVRETSKGQFVFARVVEHGEAATDLLCQLIPQWIGNLQGRRFMRWGQGQSRFSRPIRWLVALLGDKLIPVTLSSSDPKIYSGTSSRGHRLYKESICISSANKYFSALLDAGVQCDRNKRSSSIRELIDVAAKELNAKADLSVELFEELIDLVEAPFLLKGIVEERFLELPAEVLSTVMRVHQRYIPLYKTDANKDLLSLDARESLLPYFLCISNGLPISRELITKGNERVLRARLADAEFFVNTDLSISSLDRNKQLSNVTFAEGLGTLSDRVTRIEWLASQLTASLNISDPTAFHIKRSAILCKNDLVSQIIGEFPELQGIMGAKYLIAEGEPKEVALAVLEHYLPRHAGDDLPSSIAGSILALAERIELLVSIFAKGERPSGSSDPYALRRAANGILQIIWKEYWQLDFNLLFKQSVEQWQTFLPNLRLDPDLIVRELSELLRHRIVTLLEEIGIDYDLVQAVSGASVPIINVLSDPFDIRSRADLLMSMRRDGELQAVQVVVTRASRLADKGVLARDVMSPVEVVDSGLFESKSEFEMLRVIENLELIVKSKSNERYIKLAKQLSKSSKALEEFFDGKDSVMVMVDNGAIKANRLNLLGVLRNQASVLADFSQIINC